jgi:enoyl-[acyl-carrier protein] reductase I
LVGTFGENVALAPCDVSKDEEIQSFFEFVRSKTDRVDMMLHSVAFAPKEALAGRFSETTRDAFQTALDISSYSLVALARETAPLMTQAAASFR